jgi:tetratricopeptide (TPR) repeat protein
VKGSPRAAYVLAAALTMAAVAAAGGVAAQSGAVPRPGLTGAAQLARAYDAIFDARFDQLPGVLARTCPPAPEEACTLLAVVGQWWQIQIDPDNPGHDAAFEANADAAIAAIEDWVGREPMRAEAWFYLGGAYGARAQWRVLRGERIGAARDGKRIKDALERALELDPAMQDAYFGIGLYHYYADVAPAAAKILRFLMALPGGDKELGLQEMLRARSGGQLLHSEADYQLHVIYLWYEHDTERALELLHGLRDRHPRNRHFPETIARIEDVYQHDPTASLRTSAALLDAARGRRVADPAAAEATARLGMALQLDRLFESDAAVEHLRAVISAAPAEPYGAVAQAELQLGQALARLGDRSGAAAAYQAAITAAPPGDPGRITARARSGLRTTPDTAAALAYRLSLDGWRAFERGALTESSRLLTQALTIQPDNPVIQYRHARLLSARKQDGAALEQFEAVIRDGAMAPPVFYANACVDAARLYERHGAAPRALELYQLARTIFGADQRTRDTAERAIARLSAAH